MLIIFNTFWRLQESLTANEIGTMSNMRKNKFKGWQLW